LLINFFHYRLRLLDVSRAQCSCLLRCTCGVRTTKRGRNSSLTTVLNTLWYICSIILFRKLLFLLRERYGDDLSTHPDFDPDLWMEVESFGGPDKNRVYRLSNTTAENLRALNLRSSWHCSNTRLSSSKNMTTYRRLMNNSRWIMNSFAKWSWTWHHRVVIHVRLLLFGCITTSLLLLLQLHYYVNL
jgi:hypothetical protein